MVSTPPGAPLGVELWPDGHRHLRCSTAVLLKAQLRVDHPSTPLLRTFAPPPSSLAASASSLSSRFCTSQVWLCLCFCSESALLPESPHRHLLLFFPLGSDTLPAPAPSSHFTPQAWPPSARPWRADGDGEHRGAVPQRAPPRTTRSPRQASALSSPGWGRVKAGLRGHPGRLPHSSAVAMFRVSEHSCCGDFAS